ncbi:tetratricopeptide repeat protein [Marinicella meishanensis]|uniref:tetratricopeptide repeat protein n=1 Tax=Marinicella meishanensis TaxID=2873263 RepID=UPI001CC1014C|nr:tetratricopeptide repeat protein [Marinicella sp. NBU2979]
MASRHTHRNALSLNWLSWLLLAGWLPWAVAAAGRKDDVYHAQLQLTLADGSALSEAVEYKYPAHEEVHCIEETVLVVFHWDETELQVDDEQSQFVDDQLYWRAQDVLADTLKQLNITEAGQASLAFSIFNDAANRQQFTQAQAAYESADYQQTLTMLGAITAVDANQVCVLSHQAMAHSELGAYHTAIAYYDRAIAISPQNDRLYYSRGWRYKQLGDYDQALQDMHTARQFIDFFWETYYQLSHISTLMDRPLDAINYATLGLQHGNKGVMLERRGWAYINDDSPQMALHDFTLAIAEDPSDGDYYEGQAKAWYDMESYEAALKAINQAIELNQPQRYNMFLKATILDELGQLDAAETLFQEILDSKDPDRATYNNYGFNLIKSNKMQRASEVFQMALDRGFDSVLLRNNLATAWYQLGDYEQAQQTVEAAMAFSDNTDLAYEWTMLARIHIQQGQYEAAFELLKKAQQTDLDFLDAYYAYIKGEDGNFFASALADLVRFTEDSETHEIVHIKAKLLQEKL